MQFEGIADMENIGPKSNESGKPNRPHEWKKCHKRSMKQCSLCMMDATFK